MNTQQHKPPLQQLGSPAARLSPRYMVRWKMALVFAEEQGKPTFHGWTYDLSLHGTAMLTHNNVLTEAPVTVLLAPPPLLKGESMKAIEIYARQVYSVYSGSNSCYRLGLNFSKFKGDGLNILTDMLTYYRPSLYSGDKQLK